MNDFARSVDLISRAMDVSTLRYQVSANNLANAEVPNFKKSQVNFESALAAALKAEKDGSESHFEMLATRPEHIRSEKPQGWRDVKPQIVADYLTSSNANGNNVNAEEEAMNVLKTQLSYQLLAQLQAFNFEQVNLAMK